MMLDSRNEGFGVNVRDEKLENIQSRPYASAERRHRLLAEVKAVVDEMVAAELRLGLRTKRPASVNWRLAR